MFKSTKKYKKLTQLCFFLSPRSYSQIMIIRCVDVNLSKIYEELLAKIVSNFSQDTGRNLNVHKMFRRHSRHFLNVLCTFNLRLHPVSLIDTLQKLWVSTKCPLQENRWKYGILCIGCIYYVKICSMYVFNI